MVILERPKMDWRDERTGLVPEITGYIEVPREKKNFQWQFGEFLDDSSDRDWNIV